VSHRFFASDISSSTLRNFPPGSAENNLRHLLVRGAVVWNLKKIGCTGVRVRVADALDLSLSELFRHI
jgi:hypothetical protein